MQLSGTNVIVIGGSSGMGLATAQLAREAGANVTIVSRSRERLQRAIRVLGDVEFKVADFTIESDVAAVFGGFPRVDHVFVSAGSYFGANVMEADFDAFRSDVAQRLWGPLYVVRHAMPKMSNGSITFLTGQLASRPAAGAAVTGAMHAALETLAKGLALELAPIRVNAVEAGTIDTPAFGEYRDQVAEEASKRLPVKRIGSAQEVAHAVLLLMTNEFMTGEIIHVDGGERFV